MRRSAVTQELADGDGKLGEGDRQCERRESAANLEDCPSRAAGQEPGDRRRRHRSPASNVGTIHRLATGAACQRREVDL
jgi:hypothetical protein